VGRTLSKNKQPQDKHHEEIVNGLYEQMKKIFESSEQAMYLYLDDTHKACNSKFAALLGYKSPKEWAEVKGALEPFVAEKSQETLSSTYWNAMNKMIASKIPVTWKKKNGGTVDTNVILVPMAYAGHLFAVHFVS
jgi:carbohydrate-binding DOMON domain-containing protein